MIGSTVSTVGGLLKGITRAVDLGFECTQIYTTNSRRWSTTPIGEAEAKKIREFSMKHNIHMVAHVPFLVNLASLEFEKRRNSVARLNAEIFSADSLGVRKLVLHPGSVVSKKPDAYSRAIKNVVCGLNSVAKLCMEHNITILLETMSGQGTEIGRSFEELKYIISNVEHPEVLGICFDTAHVFASGYDISTVERFKETLNNFDECIGIEKIGCFHINNTKIHCGKRVDRHSSIFDGKIELDVFREIVLDSKYMKIPKIVEPPASEDDSFGSLQVSYLKLLKEGTHMQVDQETIQYFSGNVRQVFVYLTNRCQLRCRQCLYKPLLDNKSEDLKLELLIQLLLQFRKFGATKLSYLGGEPTLYSDTSSNVDFSKLVELSKGLGYSYVRVDTNGQFDPDFLHNKSMKLLDEITFSLDGFDAQTHDAMRGKGVFKKCISNVIRAVELGYSVQITSCFHNGLCDDASTGIESVLKLVSLCDDIGVHQLNFHPILKAGIARDNWIDDTEITPELWIEIYNEVQSRLEFIPHNVNVRLPMRYVENNALGEQHNYCPLKMAERALIMPDGTIKVCAFNIGTPLCVSRFSSDSVVFEDQLSELRKLEKSEQPCSNQLSPDGYCALCMSYKPNQIELIRNNRIANK